MNIPPPLSLTSPAVPFGSGEGGEVRGGEAQRCQTNITAVIIMMLTEARYIKPVVFGMSEDLNAHIDLRSIKMVLARIYDSLTVNLSLT